MKNKSTQIVLIITAVFLSFTVGIYWGGKLGHSPISISVSVEETIDTASHAVQDFGKININTASVDVLCELPGIGEVLARNIIEYRESAGGFSDIEDLKNVNGIGDKKYSAIYDLITVGEEQ